MIGACSTKIEGSLFKKARGHLQLTEDKAGMTADWHIKTIPF